MLFSGLSQFRLRPAANHQAQVSTANQKLRNRFGEFYPVQPRDTVSSANAPSVPENASLNTAHGNTFDEVVTTSSEYDHAQVTTSWSSGTSAGMPQVSVPVTINVNNGELMTQLIETRESLAEMKAQQSAVREGQRVFSYQVHKEGVEASALSHGVSTNANSSAVVASSQQCESSENSTLNTADAGEAALRGHQEVRGRRESSLAGHQAVSEVHSSSAEVSNRTTSRIRSVSEKSRVQQMPESAPETLRTPTAKPVSDSKPAAETIHSDAAVQSVAADVTFEIEARSESSTSIESSAPSIEEEVSFGPISPSNADDREDEHVNPVPVIEPISYHPEEAADTSNSRSSSEETVAEFAPLDEAKAEVETPATLPELSFEDPVVENSVELPGISPGQKSDAFGSVNADAHAASEDRTFEKPDVSDSVVMENNATSDRNAATSRRTRQQLATAFAAVRGLPPEDLFADRSVPFVTPIEPAEPVVAESSVDGNGISKDSAAAVVPADGSETSPKPIQFGETADSSLVVHPSSAAVPVDLEFGQPALSSPPVSHIENPETSGNPATLSGDVKPERWHKYRSRINRKQDPSPSTPVPPVPQVASTESSPPVPFAFQEPAPVPPALEDTLAESGSDLSITDSPLMIPDEDGTTDIALNIESEKLGSASMPPVPQMAPASEAERRSTDNFLEADSIHVYESRSVTDRLNQVTDEINAPPLFSPSPPVLSQRKMPSKTESKLPFETTIRRINKRVAWMTDAMKLPERKTASHKPAMPKSQKSGTAKKERPAHGPHPPTQGHGPAVARKSVTAPQRQLPKLSVPKFAVQKFSLPNVNFRAIQPPALQMPMLDTPDWLACPPDVMAPVRSSNTLHRVFSTMQFAGQSSALR